MVQFGLIPFQRAIVVVTHASARFRLTDNSSEAYTTLGYDGKLASDIVLPAPSFIGNNYYVVSSPVTFYVEPGSSPTLFLSGSRVHASGSYLAQASIVGYLVPLASAGRKNKRWQRMYAGHTFAVWLRDCDIVHIRHGGNSVVVL
jgi:hypothetical protein